MYKKAKIKYFSYLNSQERLIIELEAEVNNLRSIVSKQADIIAELQCRIDPYSPNGDAICNSFCPDKYYMND